MKGLTPRVLEPMQVALTKAGRIEDALALKSEVEKAKRILERGPSAAGPTQPNAGTSPSIASSPVFEPVPAFQPPLGPATLLETENWPIKVTLPGGNYRVQGKRSIQRKSDQELLFTPGSSFKGSGENPSLTLGSQVVVGKDLTFEDFAFFGDLGSRFFFQDSTFTGMDLGKSGGWFGGRFMSRWQFRGCAFNGSFAKRWNSRHFGIQATGCTFERVEFVPIEYDKDDEPSDVALQAWATIQDSHFRKCTIPVSVLSLMENCTFDGCRFDDDPSPPSFAREVKRTIYLANCTWRVKQLPARLLIEQKPLSAKP